MRAIHLLLLGFLVAGPSTADLRDELNQSVAAARRESQAMGVHVVDLAAGEQVYGFEADRRRIVASNMKLVVTAAALDRLGPGHFFETRVVARGEVRGPTFEGDLGVIGGGDPNISGRHHEGDSLAIFRSWAGALKARGIRRIDGDLLLSYGLFGPPRIHPDWPADQLSRWYEAAVEALSFNDNCVLVRVWPAPRVGEPPRVQTVPDLGLFEVENQARTVASAKRHRIHIDRVNGSNVLTVSGSFYRGADPVDSWVTVRDPVEYFGAALKKAFDEEGVELTGQIRPTPRLPDGLWREVAVERSDLMTTAEVINKRSQNFYAESLLKLMGAELCGEGTWQAGLEVLDEFLAGLDFRKGSYQMADGSGMSRNNRFTPRQMTRLLDHMFRHPRGAEFLLTLPFSGEEGLSWEERLASEPYRGNVFAKTGSLRGVSTLSGYAKARSGKIYAFSILMNQTRGTWRARRAQDRILRVLIDRG